jgi:hypothetical protein
MLCGCARTHTCCFRNFYHRNLSVTYFKYLRSFSQLQVGFRYHVMWACCKEFSLFSIFSLSLNLFWKQQSKMRRIWKGTLLYWISLLSSESQSFCLLQSFWFIFRNIIFLKLQEILLFVVTFIKIPECVGCKWLVNIHRAFLEGLDVYSGKSWYWFLHNPLKGHEMTRRQNANKSKRVWAKSHVRLKIQLSSSTSFLYHNPTMCGILYSLKATHPLFLLCVFVCQSFLLPFSSS